MFGTEDDDVRWDDNRKPDLEYGDDNDDNDDDDDDSDDDNE